MEGGTEEQMDIPPREADVSRFIVDDLFEGIDGYILVTTPLKQKIKKRQTHG